MDIDEENLLKQMSPELQNIYRAEIERIIAAMDTIRLAAGPALSEMIALASDAFAKFGQLLIDLNNALKAHSDFIEDEDILIDQ